MRRAFLIAALLVAPPLVPAAEKTQTLTFTKADLGKLPGGWKAEHTGKGEGSIWKVVADASAPSKSGYALAQMAEAPGPYFNICIVEDSRFQNGTIEVAFKAVKGKEDQGGGIVWRFQDGDNYYVCRMNPLEDNFRLYKVVAGKRQQLATSKNDVKVPVGEWHRIKIVADGEHIECYLDGKKHLDVKDATFKEPGKVGLWTKADAQSHFDNLMIQSR